MVVRILIAGFASFVCGFSYLVGLTRLMTGLLIGFNAFCALAIGGLFLLPVDAERLLLPIYEPVPAWPYFLLGLVLAAMVVVLYRLPGRKAAAEPVSAGHYKFLAGGIGGYLLSLFLSSAYWFPSDEHRLLSEPSTLAWEVFAGTCFFLIGISLSCYLLYRASRGVSEQYPDLMRRFVLGLFAFLQMDKVPLLVAYLLIYSPDSKVIFPNIAALALTATIPVGLMLIKATWDSRQVD